MNIVKISKIINENCSAIYQLGKNGVTKLVVDDEEGLAVGIIYYGETKKIYVYNITEVEFKQKENKNE